MEEGLAINTLFSSKAAVVGPFWSYARWLGVNWVQAAVALPIQIVFSIALPILLLGFALPETQGRSLLASRRSFTAAISILMIDVGFNLLVDAHVKHDWMGLPLFTSSVAAIGLLVIAARLAPAGVVHAMTESPRIMPILAGLVGVAYQSEIAEAFGGMYIDLPAAMTTALMLGTMVLYLVVVLRMLG